MWSLLHPRLRTQRGRQRCKNTKIRKKYSQEEWSWQCKTSQGSKNSLNKTCMNSVYKKKYTLYCGNKSQEWLVTHYGEGRIQLFKYSTNQNNLFTIYLQFFFVITEVKCEAAARWIIKQLNIFILTMESGCMWKWLLVVMNLLFF